MDTEELKTMREYAILYNRIVETCFEKCVFTFNYRYLVDDEIQCVNNCTQRLSGLNNRIGMNFAEYHFKKQQALSEVVAEPPKL